MPTGNKGGRYVRTDVEDARWASPSRRNQTKSTHLLKLHGGPSEGPPVFAPVRALGALERRVTRRRGHAAPGSATSAASDRLEPDEKPLYWVGDERETTYGDW